MIGHRERAHSPEKTTLSLPPKCRLQQRHVDSPSHVTWNNQSIEDPKSKPLRYLYSDSTLKQLWLEVSIRLISALLTFTRLWPIKSTLARRNDVVNYVQHWIMQSMCGRQDIHHQNIRTWSSAHPKCLLTGRIHRYQMKIWSCGEPVK